MKWCQNKNKNNPIRLKMVVWVELNEKFFKKKSKIKKKRENIVKNQEICQEIENFKKSWKKYEMMSK